MRRDAENEDADENMFSITEEDLRNLEFEYIQAGSMLGGGLMVFVLSLVPSQIPEYGVGGLFIIVGVLWWLKIRVTHAKHRQKSATSGEERDSDAE